MSANERTSFGIYDRPNLLCPSLKRLGASRPISGVLYTRAMPARWPLMCEAPREVAPHSSVMNSRRFIRSYRRRALAASPEFRDPAPSRLEIHDELILGDQ